MLIFGSEMIHIPHFGYKENFPQKIKNHHFCPLLNAYQQKYLKTRIKEKLKSVNFGQP